jgi:hypothetical protein
MNKRIQTKNGDFICRRCGNFVSADPLLSAVRNRNHCPYCLWSRHLDLYQAGDRLSACKALMRPIGLTLKKTNKRYATFTSGEVMLVHLCSEPGECGEISINRIAADDDGEKIFHLLQSSAHLEEEIAARLAREGIALLNPSDSALVERKVFGTASGWAPQMSEPMPV